MDCMNKKYLEVLKFRMYPTKEEKRALDKELHFYERYKRALIKEIEEKRTASLFPLKEKDYEEIIDKYWRKVKRRKFDYSKYFSYDHFCFAKTNVLNSYIYKNKEGIKKYPIDRVTIKIKSDETSILYGRLTFKEFRIKLKPNRDIVDKIDFINITRTNGKYFLSLARFLEVIPLEKTHLACGIDVGFDTYITLYDSNDEVMKINFENKKIDYLISKANYYKRVLTNIEKQNKEYIKSKNYYKVLHKLEATYDRISSIRSYFFNDLAVKIVKRYDLIIIEDINLEALYKVKTSKLNLQKFSFGAFFKVLEEKAQKYDKKVYRARRTFMSSQICSECGVIHHEMKDFHIRTFECECGYKADRDENAARNLLYYGLRLVRYKNISKFENKTAAREKERIC